MPRVQVLLPLPRRSKLCLLRFFVFPQKISRPRRCSSFFPKNPLIFWEPCHETGTSVSFLICLSTSDCSSLHPNFCVSTKNQSPASLLLLFPKNPLIFWEPCHETGASVSFFVCLSTSDCSSLYPDFLCFHKKSFICSFSPQTPQFYGPVLFSIGNFPLFFSSFG